jgi:hypothetical protein
MVDAYTALKELEALLRQVGDSLLAGALKQPPSNTRDKTIGAANGLKMGAMFAFTAAETNKPEAASEADRD